MADSPATASTPKKTSEKKVFFTHPLSGERYEIKRRYRDSRGQNWLVVGWRRVIQDKLTGRPVVKEGERHVADPKQPKLVTKVVELPLEDDE